MNIRIVSTVPEDAEGITNVLYKAWLATYPNKELGITKDDIEEIYKDAFTEERMKAHREKIMHSSVNQKRIVAKDGDLVIGTSTMVRNENNNQLKTIYVLPEFQGKGIGKMLWNEFKDFLDPKKDTIVQVAIYNQSAIEFYKRLGFADTGKRWSNEKWRMKSGAIIPEMEMVIKAK